MVQRNLVKRVKLEDSFEWRGKWKLRRVRQTFGGKDCLINDELGLGVSRISVEEGSGTPLQYSWQIPWTEEPGRLQSWGRWGSDTTERLYFHFSLSCIGEGNGNPLQCSCLENPRDGGACWAAVYGVAQSQTQLKWLSSSSSYLLLCTSIIISLGL